MFNIFKDKLHLAETVARRCPVKKVFFKVSQNFQENICAEASLFLEIF